MPPARTSSSNWRCGVKLTPKYKANSVKSNRMTPLTMLCCGCSDHTLDSKASRG